MVPRCRNAGGPRAPGARSSPAAGAGHCRQEGQGGGGEPSTVLLVSLQSWTALPHWHGRLLC